MIPMFQLQVFLFSVLVQFKVKYWYYAMINDSASMHHEYLMIKNTCKQMIGIKNPYSVILCFIKLSEFYI